MKQLKRELRMYIAEKLLYWALEITPNWKNKELLTKFLYSYSIQLLKETKIES